MKGKLGLEALRLKENFQDLVFDFLLSLFFPLSYFVLFILEVTAEASASVLLSAGWSTQSLFWKSTPETWDLGWKAEGGTTFREIAHQGSLECVCGLGDV